VEDVRRKSFHTLAKRLMQEEDELRALRSLCPHLAPDKSRLPAFPAHSLRPGHVRAFLQNYRLLDAAPSLLLRIWIDEYPLLPPSPIYHQLAIQASINQLQSITIILI
jgi:hypothetical protein